MWILVEPFLAGASLSQWYQSLFADLLIDIINFGLSVASQLEDELNNLLGVTLGKLWFGASADDLPTRVVSKRSDSCGCITSMSTTDCENRPSTSCCICKGKVLYDDSSKKLNDSRSPRSSLTLTTCTRNKSSLPKECFDVRSRSHHSRITAVGSPTSSPESDTMTYPHFFASLLYTSCNTKPCYSCSPSSSGKIACTTSWRARILYSIQSEHALITYGHCQSTLLCAKGNTFSCQVIVDGFATKSKWSRPF